MPDPNQRIADALVLVFTEGVSLRLWEQTGLLGREWALYERLRNHYARIVLVTWGGEADGPLAEGIGAALVANTGGAERSRFIAGAPVRVRQALVGAGTAVVKTNQMTTGGLGPLITRDLRDAGVRTALIGRGGFLASRFAAHEYGPHSREAADTSNQERELCGAADLVVGSSEEMVADLAWRYGLDPAKTACIPNYVSVEGAATPASERDTGEILFAGRLKAIKRVDLLLRAVGRLEPSDGLRLTIIGDGPDEGALRDRARGLRFPVTFEGRMPHADLRDRMARCAVYAQVSSLEGHPKTVIEAMATGAPVVVVEAPGLGCVVENEQTGLKVQPSPEAIAEALQRLLADASLRDRLGRNAAAHVRETLALERIADLEAAAHRRALELTDANRSQTANVGAVRWEPPLLDAPVEDAVTVWMASLGAYVRRLEPRQRAEFLMAIDTPLYHHQGQAAIEANDGLHPKHDLTAYHAFFTKRIKKSQRVLDLGCGVGALAESIARRSSASVTGLDLSEANLAKARERAAGLSDVLTFVEGDITTHRATGEYDVIVLSNVLEHLRDRPDLLRRWTEWYGPSRFLIRVPAFDRDWRVPWKKHLGVEWRLDPTHETEYTEAQLREETGLAGLVVHELVARWGELWLCAEPG
jgi:glycosyltransferase involved in cell wall biosynthesis/SAM-dependent methyltransferase